MCLSLNPKTFGRTESLTAHKHKKDLSQISKDRLIQSDSLDTECVFSSGKQEVKTQMFKIWTYFWNNSIIKDTNKKNLMVQNTFSNKKGQCKKCLYDLL